METKTMAIIFSAPLSTPDPLKRVKQKRPVYVELLRKCQEKGWKAAIVTRKTYQGDGIFNGYWKLKEDDTFEQVDEKLHVDLVYDRTGGLHFPIEGDSLQVVDSRDFKLLAWDKWKQYQEIGKYMAKTVKIERASASDREKLFGQLKTDWIVLKPTNGLKGLGIFIGPKREALQFTIPSNTVYIAQEFIDTRNGIAGITNT